MKHWLMKSEPGDFSIDDLERVVTEPWTGVRNYQARNFMRQMKPGDTVLFYHSNCPVPGVYGIAEVATTPYPDPTQFKRKSRYFDPKATPEQPRWELVDVRYVRRLDPPVPLALLREHADDLEGMAVLARGSRLSVQPVTPYQYRTVLKLESAARKRNARQHAT